MEFRLLAAFALFLFIVGVLVLSQTGPQTAIVSLVKEPHAFRTWIEHHQDKMKISHFYIFLDEDSEDLGTFGPNVHFYRNWKERLGYKHDATIDEPANVRVKQDLIVKEGLRLAEKDRIKYIVHIDSDELLHGPRPASEVFARYPVDAFHMENIELAPDRMDYKNCFREGRFFHKNPERFIAYGNGKAAGVVGRSVPYGPHNFKGKRVQEILKDELVVLHYPSCNIEETMKRAKNYGKFKDDSAGWSDHHKETRDAMTSCSTDCRERAEKQFKKRMAGVDSYEIDVGLKKCDEPVRV